MIAPLRIQTRPTQIARAAGLLCLSLVIGAVKVIFSWRLFGLTTQDAVGLPFIMGTSVLALNVLLIWKLWQGRNWARTTLLVLFVIGLLRTATALVPNPGVHISPVLAILQVLQLVIWLYALFLIYGPKAQSWFQPKKTQVL